MLQVGRAPAGHRLRLRHGCRLAAGRLQVAGGAACPPAAAPKAAPTGAPPPPPAGTIPKLPANILLVKNLTVCGVYWGSYATKAPRVFRQGRATRTQLPRLAAPCAAKRAAGACIPPPRHITAAATPATCCLQAQPGGVRAAV